MRDNSLLEVVRQHSTVLEGDSAAARLLDAVDPKATMVLIGEATHGTHEFYRHRAELTRASDDYFVAEQNARVVQDAEAFHRAMFRGGADARAAIGVLCRPDTERASHYFAARLPEQFTVVVHVDRTHALEPLERWARHEIDLPETDPTGV